MTRLAVEHLGGGVFLDAVFPKEVDGVGVGIEHSLGGVIPVLRLAAFFPIATAATVVADGEVGEQGELHLLAEMLARPAQAVVVATNKIVAANQGISAHACGEATDEGTATESKSAELQIGDETAHRATGEAREHASDALIHALWQVEMIAGNLAGLILRRAAQAVRLDELVGGLLHSVGELRGEFLACVIVFAVQFLTLPADALQQRLGAYLHAIHERGGELLGEQSRRAAEGFDIPLMPGLLDVLKGGDAGALHQRGEHMHEAVLLHPAAGKSIERQHLTHKTVLRQMRPPSLDLARLDLGGLRLAGLI